MSVNLTLLILMGAMFACAVYLILERTLTRVLLGLVLLTNAANLLLILVAGRAKHAPLFHKGAPAEDYSDPLPQALILTSIVIGFSVTALMLGIIYRSWKLARRDDVQDDREDLRVATQTTYSEEEPELGTQDATEFAPLDSDDDADAADRPPADQAARQPAGDPGGHSGGTNTADRGEPS